MHTEEEAQQKWCPFARGVTAHSQDQKGAPNVNHPQGAINRIYINGEPRPYIPEQSLCIASECMAWRWGEDATKIGQIKAVRKATGAGPRECKTFVEENSNSFRPSRGFCGLAGRDQ